MNDIDEFENKLRVIESKLEEIGKDICDVKGSSCSHGDINRAIYYIQSAIRHSYQMDC